MRYFAWLEEELGKGAQLNEYDAATRLEQFRSYVLSCTLHKDLY